MISYEPFYTTLKDRGLSTVLFYNEKVILKPRGFSDSIFALKLAKRIPLGL